MVTYYDIVKATRRKMRKEKISTPKLVRVLNSWLPLDDQIPQTRTGVVQLSRWLNPESDYHVTPRANVGLALLQWSFGVTLIPPE